MVKDGYHRKNYLNAIVHCYLEGRKDFKKYHHINNQEGKLQKFEQFARTLPGADYVNYYWEENRQFAFRRYLTPK